MNRKKTYCADDNKYRIFCDICDRIAIDCYNQKLKIIKFVKDNQ